MASSSSRCLGHPLLQLLVEPAQVLGQLVAAALEQELLLGVPQHRQQIVRPPGFGKVVIDVAAVDRLHRVFQFGVAGHQQANGLRVVLPNPFEEVDAGALRHALVGQDEVDGAAAKTSWAASGESAVNTSNSSASNAARVGRMYGSSSTIRREHLSTANLGLPPGSSAAPLQGGLCFPASEKLYQGYSSPNTDFQKCAAARRPVSPSEPPSVPSQRHLPFAGKRRKIGGEPPGYSGKIVAGSFVSTAAFSLRVGAGTTRKKVNAYFLRITLDMCSRTLYNGPTCKEKRREKREQGRTGFPPTPKPFVLGVVYVRAYRP